MTNIDLGDDTFTHKSKSDTIHQRAKMELKYGIV